VSHGDVIQCEAKKKFFFLFLHFHFHFSFLFIFSFFLHWSDTRQMGQIAFVLSQVLTQTS